MDTQSDVGILAEIYAAERRADRIVRDAEADAKALVAGADAAARADTVRRGEELARRAADALGAETGAIDAGIGRYLSDREAETGRWSRRRRAEIDRMVDRLAAMVLPP